MPNFDVAADTWTTLNRLLDVLLDLPAIERGPWVDNLSSEYEALKPRLRDLLARAQQMERSIFLHTIPKFNLGLGGEDVHQEPFRHPGDSVGPYLLVSELAAGGMGTVWLAERRDRVINRPVALKLPHGTWQRPELAERMTREREILASLSHPNIARLYDAGFTTDGQPYLALECVEGRHIDDYAREKKLSLNSRLHLFRQVANGVAHAHAQLVVHRDLKPSNILVTEDGQVRLLDFGIAKLLDRGQARETELTQISGRVLTLDYASPEQIAGKPIGICSDVYSLGVVLYELLTGARPYRLKRDSRGALEDAILQSEPVCPSEVAVEAQFRKALRGDLDTIILKALKKKPEERYATVNAFVDDIECYQNGRPVTARPDS